MYIHYIHYMYMLFLHDKSKYKAIKVLLVLATCQDALQLLDLHYY